MTNLNEMNLTELKEYHALLVDCRNERYQLLKECNFKNCDWSEQLDQLVSMVFEVETLIQSKEEITIYVSYESGYRWSVYLSNEDESRITNVSKAEAVAEAKHINREEFNGQAVLDIYTMSKKEKAENVTWMHENTLTYDREYNVR